MKRRLQAPPLDNAFQGHVFYLDLRTMPMALKKDLSYGIRALKGVSMQQDDTFPNSS